MTPDGKVAPFAGAWIETCDRANRAITLPTSPPSRGRGSKLELDRPGFAPSRRPLRGGVDRNIESRDRRTRPTQVAPFAGAWIETSMTRPPQPRSFLSPPSRGRGSKPACRGRRCPARQVAPFAGAWIETRWPRPRFDALVGSPPSRGRGSKPRVDRACDRRRWSPPSRGRGSKLQRRGLRSPPPRVAPFAGAWIETLGLARREGGSRSPPSRGRGSKLVIRRQVLIRRPGRPLRGGVDRNLAGRGLEGAGVGRPLRGGVDRNRRSRPIEARGAKSPPSRGRGSKPQFGHIISRLAIVAPFAGAWIETRPSRWTGYLTAVAPFAGAWIETMPPS